MTRFLMFVCLLLSLLDFNCQNAISKNVILLTPEGFKSSLNNDSIQLIDVRKPTEYNTGHIHNALNIDFLSNDFISNISELNNQKPVYIYCRSGKRSSKSVFEFEKAGFTKIYNLKGGILNWKSQGFDIQIKN